MAVCKEKCRAGLHCNKSPHNSLKITVTQFYLFHSSKVLNVIFSTRSFHSLQNAAQQQGFTQPTPVQSEVTPSILAGKDVLASAQTGSGKTAAYCLPVLEWHSAQSDYTEDSAHADSGANP
jgi:superfamily II DNA/RNA helicase